MPGQLNHPLILLSGDVSGQNNIFWGRKTKFKAVFGGVPTENMYFFRWQLVNGNRILKLYRINPNTIANTFTAANLEEGQIDFNGHMIINAEGSKTQDEDPYSEYRFKPATDNGAINYILGDRFFDYLHNRNLLRNGLDINHIDFFCCNLGRGSFIGALRGAIDAYNANPAGQAAPINVAADGIRACYFYVNRPPGTTITFSLNSANTQECATTIQAANPVNWNNYNTALNTVQNIVNPGHVLFTAG